MKYLEINLKRNKQNLNKKEDIKFTVRPIYGSI